MRYPGHFAPLGTCWNSFGISKGGDSRRSLGVIISERTCIQRTAEHDAYDAEEYHDLEKSFHVGSRAAEENRALTVETVLMHRSLADVFEKRKFDANG